MRVIFDTNVLLDVFEKREPFFAASVAATRVSRSQVSAHILASQINDIYYLLRKFLRSPEPAREIVKDLFDSFDVIDLMTEDSYNAAHSSMTDFEDAVIAYRAKRLNADYIVTRNVKDYSKSPVKAITPEDFLNLVAG